VVTSVVTYAKHQRPVIVEIVRRHGVAGEEAEDGVVLELL
jgi:hypothetical protein